MRGSCNTRLRLFNPMHPEKSNPRLNEHKLQGRAPTAMALNISSRELDWNISSNCSYFQSFIKPNKTNKLGFALNSYVPFRGYRKLRPGRREDPIRLPCATYELARTQVRSRLVPGTTILMKQVETMVKQPNRVRGEWRHNKKQTRS